MNKYENLYGDISEVLAKFYPYCAIDIYKEIDKYKSIDIVLKGVKFSSEYNISLENACYIESHSK